MQSRPDQTDAMILNEYPAPLAAIYHRVVTEEDIYLKPRLITAAFDTLLKYCLVLTLQECYRTKVNPARYSATIIEQLLNLTTPQTVKLLIEYLRLLRNCGEVIIEKELFLLVYDFFREEAMVRDEVMELFQTLLAFAEKYPAQLDVNYQDSECELDYQSHYPILRALYYRVVFLARMPLLYFHDPMDELEAIEQVRENSLAAAETLMGVQAIPEALAAGRFPGAPLGRLAVKTARSNIILSLHPLMMMVETIEMATPAPADGLPIGPHVIIFYDEIRGKAQEKLLRYWQLDMPRLVRDLDAPKLTITSPGGLFNQLAGLIKIGRSSPKTRAQIAQQVSKLIGQRNLTGAIIEFKKIYEAEPDNLAIAARLGELYLHAGQAQEARDLFLLIAERCLDDGMVPQALLMYQRATFLDPQNIDFSLRLANLCAEQQCNELALQQCERIVSESLQVNYQEGAIKAMELAAQVAPHNPIIHQRLADLYLAANNRAAALKSLLTAGEELLSQHQSAAAQAVYEQVLTLKPYHQLAYAMLGQIYLDAGNYEKAIEMLVPSYQSDPANAEVLNNLGRAYLNNNQLEEAEATFINLFALNKTCYDQLLELGRRFLFQGDLERVGAIVERCLYTLIARGKEAHGIALLESCLAHNPRHLPTLKQLIDIYLLVRDNDNLFRTLQRLASEARRQGNYPEAKTALRQLAALDPTNPDYIAQLRTMEGPIKRTIGFKRDKPK